MSLLTGMSDLNIDDSLLKIEASRENNLKKYQQLIISHDIK